MASEPKTATRASSRLKSQITAPQAIRATRAKAGTIAATALPTTEPPKKKLTRKPLANRDNERSVAAIRGAMTTKATHDEVVNEPAHMSTANREQIMAYLRIRPYLGEDTPTCLPYLTSLSDTTVCMTDPNQQNQLNRNKFRPSALPSASKYTFSRVFPPTTTQGDFFTKTTLPLVNDVLQGQNALLFAYGVTNSGKTYTVQGATKEGSAGIVPRTLDVLFNSIEGLSGDERFRPVRLQDIEQSDSADVFSPPLSFTEPRLREVFADHFGPNTADPEADPTSLTVDRNYGYCIWLSYAEIYNDKVYDLLENVKDESTIPKPASNIRSAPSGNAHPLRVTRKALQMKSCPRSESESLGKYIDGLRQFHVQSASQAKALLKLGQLHRRVFGTLANKESSRSHALVIIKLVRGHRGERDDITSFQVSRLTLVDLAGSERNKQTQTTGDRLKEAGNINKSLMVLGQCLEALCTNQRRTLANAIVEVGKTDFREPKKALALVPFRHSKLTEVLMDYFVGDGRVVIIVNINPFDTGYDENSHVMKFAALAREVYVTPAPAPTRHLATAIPQSPIKVKASSIEHTEVNSAPHRRRKVRISTGGNEMSINEAVVEILEEDEPNEHSDEDGDNEPINPLVDALFDEIEELGLKLFESEMRCAIVEAETREEVMKEMEERMRSMERMFAKRLMTEVVQNEMKTDAKIDLLHQSGLFGNSPMKKNPSMQKLPSPQKLPWKFEQNADSDSEEDCSSESDEQSSSESLSGQRSSPLSGKKNAGKGKKHIVGTSTSHQEIRQFLPDGPEAILLPSDEEEVTEESETEDDEDMCESVTESRTSSTTVSDESDDDSDSEWAPPERTPRPTKSKAGVSFATASSLSLLSPAGRGAEKKDAQSRVSKVAQEINDMSLASDDSFDLLSPNKRRDEQESSRGQITAKKKRPLRKKAVTTFK